MDRYIEFVTNHWMLFIALIVVIILLIQDLLENAFQKTKLLSPIQAVAEMNNSETVVIDCREPHEYTKGHIPNSINVPLGKIDEKINELNLEKQRPVIVACQIGSRSSAAGKKLSNAGFEHIYALRGGIQAWEDNHLPLKKGTQK